MDDWGVRKLAYAIKKKDRGHYFFLLLNMDESTVGDLDKFYRTMDLILRHLFVVVDEKEKDWRSRRTRLFSTNWRVRRSGRGVLSSITFCSFGLVSLRALVNDGNCDMR